MMESCWHNDKTTPQQMIKGAEGKLWPKLKDSWHVNVLKDLIKLSGNKNILDLGCGAAELITILPPDYSYCGADLSHIINLVAKKMHPELSYIECDANKDDMLFLSDYDFVIMNAFIDISNNPVEMLKRVLNVSTGHVLMHRQAIGNQTTYIINKSYGGLTYKSILNRTDLNNVVKSCEFKTLKEITIQGDEYSFLFSK